MLENNPDRRYDLYKLRQMQEMFVLSSKTMASESYIEYLEDVIEDQEEHIEVIEKSRKFFLLLMFLSCVSALFLWYVLHG